MLTALTLSDNWDETEKPTTTDPLLVENNKRFVLFPIQYNKIWQSYKSNEARFWSAEEIELAGDLDDWNSLPRKDRSCLLTTIASFLTLNPNVVSRLNTEIQAAEARAFFGFQIMQCAIHTELFSVILDMFCNNAADSFVGQDVLGESLMELPSLSRKQAWVLSHITESGANFTHRLACTVVYYRVAMASIAALSTLVARKLILPGFVHACAKTFRDWSGYAFFCTELLKSMSGTPSQGALREVIKSLVDVELSLVDDLTSVSGGYLSVGGVVDPGVLKGFVKWCGNKAVKEFGAGDAVWTIEDGGEWASICEVDLGREARRDEVEEVVENRVAMGKVGGQQSEEREFDLDMDF